MKTNFTLFIKSFAIAAVLFAMVSPAKAQCVAPAMVWQNPVLISGTAGQVGAKYKFPSVTAGVDGIIEVLAFNGGATLTDIDDNNYGYSAAWQPVVKTPAVQGASSSYVSFRIEFHDSATGNPHTYNCFQLSFIDVDGDGQHVKEFVAAKSADSVRVSLPTALTVTSLSGNMTQVTGPIANYTNIDTSAWATNVNFKFANKYKVDEVRVGSVTDATFTVQDRYACAYFAQVSMPNISNALPVKYASFDAAAINNTVTLKWVTENEINNHHFEVERSFDGMVFKTAALVLDASVAAGSSKTYFFKDNSTELLDRNLVYYRLKQVDNDGRITYTGILAVRMQANGVKMQVSPNPFVENLSVRFASTENGTAQIQILTAGGQKILSQQTSIIKGNNAIQLQGISKLNPGVYVAQLLINGVIIDNQKIIKN